MDAKDEELFSEFLSYAGEMAVVEGAKDENALELLGFTRITRLNRGGSLLDAVESLSGSRVAVLTDLDQEGKILRKKFLALGSQHGIQEIKRPREILAQLRVSHVEGLAKRARNQLLL